MLTLYIDTHASFIELILFKNGKVLDHVFRKEVVMQSSLIMPSLEDLLMRNNVVVKDLSDIIVINGPGSFTGIRIGIATAKAFHDSLSIPCIGVSSLESFAYSIEKDGLIVSILDAKNDNCYFALYERKNSIYREILAPSTDTITNALRICKPFFSAYHSVTFIGDGLENDKDFFSFYLAKYSFQFLLFRLSWIRKMEKK